MAKYVVVYTGGSMPDSEAERQAVMDAWTAWIGGLGSALTDVGNPFGPSKGIAADGSVTDGGESRLSGYSIVEADSLDAATELSGGCPVLAGGGAVEVYETFDVM